MQIDSKCIENLFPKYKSLFQTQPQRPNDQLQYFIKQQLPELIKILENLDSTFTKLTHTHNTLIMKKVPAETLFQSFVRKVGDKVEKYFNALDDSAGKQGEGGSVFDFQAVRAEVRQELEGVSELLARKFNSKIRNVQRAKEEEIVESLYAIIEYYQWTKSDTATIGSKFRLDPSLVLQDIKQKTTPSDPFSLITLQSTFKPSILQYIHKKCRPFLQKRQFLLTKLKQLCRQSDSRTVTIPPKQYLRTILTRQSMRCDRDILKTLQQQLKSLTPDKSYDEQIPEINQQLSQIKTQFQKLKNSNYYLDIIRGNFIETYQMQTKKLENVFTIGRLEKYLQEVYALSERMRALLDRVVDNRRAEKLSLGDMLENAVDRSVELLRGNFRAGPGLGELIREEVTRVRVMLEDLPQEDVGSTGGSSMDAASRYREEQKARQKQREQRIAAQRQRRQQQSRKRKQQLQSRAQKEKENRQRKKLDEVERQRKLQQQRHERQQLRRIESEKQRIRAQQDKIRKLRQQQELKKRREQQEEIRKKQMEDRKREQEEQKKRQEALQKQKQQEEELARKERLAQEQKRKQEQIKKEQERQKQMEEDKRIQAEKLAEQKKKDQDKKLADQARIQRQKQQSKQKQQQRLQRQAQQKKKRQQERKQFQRKQKQRLQNQRKQRQKIQNQKKQRQKLEKQRKQKQKLQQQRKQQQRRENQRLEKQRRQKQKLQNEKKEKQRIEKQKKEKQRLEKQRIEKQKLEKERIQKQKLEKQKLEKERLEKERLEKEKLEKERIEKEKKEKLEKERLEQERKEKEKRDKQEQDRKEKERIEQEKKEKEKKEQERKEKEKRDLEEKERLRLEEEKKKKDAEQASKAGSTKPSILSKNKDKKGGFDYQNMYDDDDDIVDEDAPPQKPSTKPAPAPVKQPATKPAPKKDDDFQFLNNQDVDFGPQGTKDQYQDDFQPPQGQAQPQDNVQTKQLLSPSNLKLLNDYLKGSQYLRKNKVNVQPFNIFRHFITLFQQFVQNNQIYFFDDQITKHIFTLAQQIENVADFEQHVQEIKSFMREAYASDLQMEGLFPETKYIFPISFENQLGVRIVEVLPRFNEFIFVVDRPVPQAEEAQEYFYALIDTFQGLFSEEIQQEEPQIQFRVLSPENLTIISTFEKYIPTMLILFNNLYEQKNSEKITIDQYTIERFFYCSHALENVYNAIENEQQELNNFYEKMTQKFSNNDITVDLKKYSIADPKFTQMLINDFKSSKDSFLKGQVKTLLTLYYIQRVDEQDNPSGQTVIYTQLSKTTPKPTLNMFLFVTNQQSHHYNQKLFELLMPQQDTRFEIGMYLDYTRHDGLYRYCTWALPLWAHIMTKKKMKAVDALAVLNFSMLPVYTAWKGQD